MKLSRLSQFMGKKQFRDYVKPFATVYREITRSLKEFRRKELPQKPATDARWFAYLIVHFKRKYNSWENATGGVHSYLDKFHQRRVPGLLRLAGHAYLHISHDLALVVADSLAAQSGRGTRGNPPPISRARAQVIFLRPTSRFYSVFIDTMGKWEVAGIVGKVSYIIPWRRAALSALADWMIALRSTAWIHGEILFASNKRPQLEDDLITALNDAADEALKEFWIIGRWRLRPPVLLDAAIASMLALTATQLLDSLLIVVVVAAASLLLYSRWRYRGLTVAINLFGLLISRNTNRVMFPTSSEPAGGYPKP